MISISKEFRIEPCILVRDRIKVERGVSYSRRDLTQEVLADGSEVRTWETDRVFRDPAEAREAQSVYAKIRNSIRSVCVKTDVGFVCPESRRADLYAAIEQGKQLAQEFNDCAKHCHVSVVVVCTALLPSNDDGASVLREKLFETLQALKISMGSLDLVRARENLYATKNMIDVIADADQRSLLQGLRDDAAGICKDLSALIKAFDGSVANALASEQGSEIRRRAASWAF